MKSRRYFCCMNSLMFVEIDGTTKKNVDNTIFQIIKIIGIFEKKWNIFFKKSTISKLNKRKNRWCYVESYTADILNRVYCFTKEKETGYSVFAGIYAKIWKYSLSTETIPMKSDIEKLREKFSHADMQIRGRFIKVNEEEAIDLGGCAKGYIAEYVKKKFINKKGVRSIILNLGGNILVSTKEDDGVEVRIENPVNKTISILYGVKDSSIVTSGDYIQCFSKDGKLYHHIINLDTGYPVESPFCSVTVCQQDGFVCDCLATYFYTKGLEAIEECERDGIAAIFTFKDGKIIFTSNAKKYNIKQYDEKGEVQL